MSDRELLEAAAKAAGLRWIEHYDGALMMWDNGNSPASARMAVNGMYSGWLWSPLTDDGDALRLSVRLKIPLQFPDWQDIARTWGPQADGEGFFEPALQHNGDLGAATRRAIVRAAASLASQNNGKDAA